MLGLFGKRYPFVIDVRPGMSRQAVAIGSTIFRDDGRFVIAKIHSVEIMNGNTCRVIGMCKPDPKEVKQ